MKRLIAALAILLSLTGAAHALSDSTYKKMLKDSDFAKADRALNQAWKNAKSSLDSASFKALQKEQAQWVKRGRDDEVRPLLSEISRTKAYAVVTQKRAEYINEYVSQMTGEDEFFEDPDSANDVPASAPDNDLPEDLPTESDLPDYDTPNNDESKNDSKASVIDSKESASEFLEGKLIDMGKIAPNESLEDNGTVEINGEECWEFSSQFNFAETGRYAISKSGKIYEFDGDKFVSVK